jgi:hypothetical protein
MISTTTEAEHQGRRGDSCRRRTRRTEHPGLIGGAGRLPGEEVGTDLSFTSMCGAFVRVGSELESEL